MVKEVEICMALLVLLIGILVSFNARFIVKNKFNDRSENIAVNIMKGIGYVLCATGFVVIYYLK